MNLCESSVPVPPWHGKPLLSESFHPPGFRRTGLFFPLQKRTLLKTLKMCRSHRDLGSLLGLERRLLVATLSLLDSRAWRFCLIRELAIAAAISLRGGRSHRGTKYLLLLSESEADDPSVRNRWHVAWRASEGPSQDEKSSPLWQIVD